MIELYAIALSIITLVQIWAYGLGNRLAGPVVGLVTSCCWIAYCLLTDQWGLQILNVASLYLHARNFFKWRTT